MNTTSVAMHNKYKKFPVLACIVCLLIFLGLWFLVIAPRLTKIPNDFSYSADVVSVDNPYNEELSVFEGERYSKTVFSYFVIGHTGHILNIKNVFDVTSLDRATM
jgi:hypothetical protein